MTIIIVFVIVIVITLLCEIIVLLNDVVVILHNLVIQIRNCSGGIVEIDLVNGVNHFGLLNVVKLGELWVDPL